MKNVLIGFAVLMFITEGAKANLSPEEFFQNTDAFLKLWVTDGSVDYQGIQNHLEAAEELYQSIGQMKLEDMSQLEQKAFYLNAYNFIVIYQVSKYYPLSSPLDQSGFFDIIKHVVAGESMTLNHLEIAKIIIPYRDPRIHFALACASASCPKLASFAYSPQNLDIQLEQRARLSINDKSFIRIEPKSKKVLVSKIFAWYKNDFVYHGQSIRGFIDQYRDQALPADFSLDYYEYHWILNVKEMVGR